MALGAAYAANAYRTALELGELERIVELGDQILNYGEKAFYNILGGTTLYSIAESVKASKYKTMPTKVVKRKFGGTLDETYYDKVLNAYLSKRAKRNKRNNIKPQEPGPMSSTTNNGGEVSVVPVPRQISKIAPDYFTIKLPYADQNVFTGLGLVTHNLALNDIVDVDQTSAGHQPMGRDTWASIFKYYRVLGCKVSIDFYNREGFASADQDKHVLVGYELLDDVTANSQSKLAFMETKNAERQILTPTFVGGSSHCRMEYEYSPSKWTHHVTERGIEERWTAINSQPNVKHFLQIRACYIDGTHFASTALDVLFNFHIQFIVQFREHDNSIIHNTD